VKQVLLLDNYDSFTYNLLDYLETAGAACSVLRNDEPGLFAAAASADAIVLSPGPGTPETAGQLMECIARFIGQKPMLGICLGHQALGLHFGGVLQRAAEPMHGKTSEVLHDGKGVFSSLPNPLRVCRYHSLLLADAGTGTEITARTADQAIMGLRNTAMRCEGLQFHPEAILTNYGREMIQNWLSGLD
jgi:anthranilate synthase/aminodeoxychorismate synthase-like glutamine amidotransferase